MNTFGKFWRWVNSLGDSKPKYASGGLITGPDGVPVPLSGGRYTYRQTDLDVKRTGQECPWDDCIYPVCTVAMGCPAKPGEQGVPLETEHLRKALGAPMDHWPKPGGFDLQPKRKTWGERLTLGAIACIGASLLFGLVYGLVLIAERAH